LDSIAKQNYPGDSVELIFSDGGSVDGTSEIIQDFKTHSHYRRVILVKNKLKTGEAGKATALKAASSQIICFIDSDNILDGRDWLERMVEPFADEDIICSEPIRYSYRKEDSYITRYCAMLGMNDPLCYFMGNYDRECVLSRKWTRMPYKLQEENSRYLKVQLDPVRLPTIGANGFFIRRKELDNIGIGDFLVDIDILPKILSTGSAKSVAKVKVGIVHIFALGLGSFFLKQKRRISDFRFARKSGSRSYNWSKINLSGLLFFAFSCISLVPLLFQAVKGYTRKNDPVWLMHPVFCIVTFYIYLYGALIGFSVLDRSRWQVK
jgi:glycosyltransferase involved in cell wall biosynthesis